MNYQRNMHGYGQHPPSANWPGGAKIAVQFVLNYEEGGENSLAHGDTASEAFLSDIAGAAPWPNQRHWNMESLYEYGARAGFWRLHRMFTQAMIPLTVYGVATALARSPEQVAAMNDAGWEIASHGLKWVEHKDMTEAEERASIAEAIRLHSEVVGAPPRGWYTGRCSMNTVRLVAEEGGFDYISDTYDDDLPYWIEAGARDQLIIPYTLEANDMRFAVAPGYTTGQQFFEYLKDAFDLLRAEGAQGQAKMLSVGLHCRLIGRPGKAAGLKRFLDYIQTFDDVWCPRRIDIAAHWRAEHPPQRSRKISQMSDGDCAAYLSALSGLPDLAARAAQIERGPAHDGAAGIHSLLCRALRRMSDQERADLQTQLSDLFEETASPGEIKALLRRRIERARACDD